ncbi:MAG: tRNA-dihydrouridine synthase family protein [Promethearchaeota archaeon]
MVSNPSQLFQKYSQEQKDDHPVLFFAPLEPITANPIIRELMGESGAQILSRPKILPKHLLKAKKWQFWQKIPRIHSMQTPNQSSIFDGIQLIARPDDPLKPTLEFITHNAKSLGIQFIDLNFCCPGYKILPKRRGGELLNNHHDLILEVIEKSLKFTDLPISIKIRKGYTNQDTPKPLLVKIFKEFGTNLSWITVNRAPVRMGGVDLNNLIHDNSSFLEAIESVEAKIPIIANGGIRSVKDIKEITAQTPVQGIMIGRGALGNPQIFTTCSHLQTDSSINESDEDLFRFYQGLSNFFEIAQKYKKGNKGRWITMGEMKRQLFYFLKYYYESRHQPHPAGLGFDKWNNKSHFSGIELMDILKNHFSQIKSPQWKDWFRNLNLL